MEILPDVSTEYEASIKKLAKKNDVEYSIMLENWQKKFEEFSNITNNYGITEETDYFDKNTPKTLIALTINGSIVIASVPNNNGVRNVCYQSIKIRTDDSKSVPEMFDDRLKEDVKKNDKILFERTMETSVIIRIKTADNILLEDFSEKAEELTYEFTKVFEKIDDATITKRL